MRANIAIPAAIRLSLNNKTPSWPGPDPAILGLQGEAFLRWPWMAGSYARP